MALGKQKISIPFIAGIDTKHDDKQMQPGNLLTAENVIFENPGKLKKCNGYKTITKYDINENKLDSIHSIAPANLELIGVTDKNLYAFSEGINRWVPKGKLVDVFATSKEIIKNDYNHKNVDSLFVENTKVIAYEETTGATYASATIGVRQRSVASFLLSGGNLTLRDLTGVGPARNHATATILVNTPAPNDGGNTVLVEFSGNSETLTIYVTPNDGTYNGGVPIYITTAELVELINTGAVVGKLTRVIGGANRVMQDASDGSSQLITVASDVNGASCAFAFGLGFSTPVTITSRLPGTAYNNYALTTLIQDPAANPSDSVIVYFEKNGETACNLRVIPNDGTHNGGTPVDITSSQLVECINTGAIVGRNVTLQDPNNLRTRFSATGGSITEIVEKNGEGDGNVFTLLGATDSTSLGVYYSVVDANNNVISVSNQKVSSGINPRLANIKNDVFIFYVNSGKISYKKFNIVNPNSLSAEVDSVTTLNASNVFDVASNLNRITIGYHDTADNLKYFQIYADLTSTSKVTKSISGITSLDLNVDPNNKILFSVVHNSIVSFFAIPFNILTDFVPLTTIDSGTMNVKHSTSMWDGTKFIVYYDVSSSNTYDYLIKQNTITTSAVVGTSSVFCRSVSLAGKAISIYGDVYIPTLHVSTLQSSYFIQDAEASVVDTISPALSGGILETACALPKLAAIDSGSVLFPSVIKGRIVSENGTFDTLFGVTSSVITFAAANPSQTTFIADELHLANGIVHVYDGVQVVEHGFYLYPENISYTTSSTGGVLSNGIYQYVALYSWTDNKGFRHLSSPSVAITATLGGGTSTQAVVITVPTLRLTNKSNVVVDLYRTEAGGTIFYKVTSVNTPYFNDTSVDSIVINDNAVNDTQLISRETLYTTGGVLENIIPPQASAIESFKNRIFLAGLENPNRLQYSKIRIEGAPVEFNDTLYRDIIPFGGDIVSLKSMDDKLVIFKERAIFYMSGDGPNNLGQQDTFTEAELISSDAGCKNKNSICLTPMGLFFQSAKGIYLLNRSLQLEYKGAAVEKYNNLEITSAKTVETKNLIIFTTVEGTSIVYNYFLNQWSTFTNMPATDAENINNLYYYLRTDGTVLVEDSGFSNDGTNIPIKVETPWLNFANVQGFQRIYRMLILGEFKSPHKLKVSVAYDFKDSVAQEVIIDTADFIDSLAYGEYSPYGEEELYGSDGNLMQIRINFQRQKCQTIKITIEDITVDKGESLTLSNLIFLVGAKNNTTTVNNSNRYAITN